MWWVHSSEGISLLSMYSHAKDPLYCFRNVIKFSISSGVHLGLTLLRIFLGSISTRMIFKCSSMGIVSTLLTRTPSVSYYCSSLLKVLSRIWYACLVIENDLLMKLQMVSSSVSFLKVKSLPMVRKGWVFSSSSKSTHNGVSTSEMGLYGGYKVKLLVSVPSNIVIDLDLQLIYASDFANHGLPIINGCPPNCYLD